MHFAAATLCPSLYLLIISDCERKGRKEQRPKEDWKQKSCLNSSPDSLSLWDDWTREKDGHKYVLVLSEILNQEGRNEIREDKGRLRGKPSVLRGEISRNLGPIMYRVHQMFHSRVALSFPAARGFLAINSQCEIHATSGREIHSSEYNSHALHS